jgi:hypothetical protein
MYWLLDSKSQLLAENKLLLYNPQTYLGLWRPIVEHGFQFKQNSIEILQRFQSQYLRIILHSNQGYIMILTCHALETK